MRFLGSRRDMHSVYEAVDGLVLPTRYDAFGLVLLEAAACGLPVVVSRAAGASELLADDAAVVIADAHDADAFAQALDSLSDAGERERLGNRGREIAEAHRWEVQIPKLRALYAECRA